MHEVSGARTHEHLDAASGSNLKGRRNLVECQGEAAAGQVPTDFHAVRPTVARAANPQGVFDANFNNRHGFHLS